MAMKYIRTKTGLCGVETRLNNKQLFEYLSQFDNYKDSLLKVADTIEELCDEFVIKAYISSYPQIYHSVDLEELNKFREKDTIVYGAVWTDKGLIYVAKMNEKGELELL